MKLNIIGCGRLGKPIGRALGSSDIFTVGGVVNQSPESTEQAVAFLGSGTVCDKIEDLPPAEVVMIACSDDNIKAVCDEAVATKAISKSSIVFHCSGAHSSAILSSASAVNAHTGSLHPMKSFADPERSFANLKGSYCGIEGDNVCRDLLESVAKKIGMNPFALEPESKVFYHAGAVIVCNYLVALLEAGYRSFEKAGVDRKMATVITKPFIEETIQNVFENGTVESLTGPIARGDKEMVKHQYQSLKERDPLSVEAYSALGQIAVQLSRQKEAADERNLAAIEALLSSDLRDS